MTTDALPKAKIFSRTNYTGARIVGGENPGIMFTRPVGAVAHGDPNLHYERGCGGRGVNAQFLLVSSIGGVKTPPQPWARGLLPIIPFSQVQREDLDSSLDAFRYRPDHLNLTAKTSVALLLVMGWNSFWDGWSLTGTMQSIGIVTNPVEVHRIIQNLEQAQLLYKDDNRGERLEVTDFTQRMSQSELNDLLGFMWATLRPYTLDALTLDGGL